MQKKLKLTANVGIQLGVETFQDAYTISYEEVHWIRANAIFDKTLICILASNHEVLVIYDTILKKILFAVKNVKDNVPLFSNDKLLPIDIEHWAGN